MAKRILDIVFSSVLLILLSPVMAVLALALAVDVGRPVIFRQARPGLGGRLFTLYKFRTMRDEEIGPNGEFIDDNLRVTPFSTLIRRAGLDELPELFNVLKGDMSMVGPRPLLPEYLGMYTPEQARRHEVKPGITGLAQAQGRRDLPFSKRLELDVYYVDHHSLWLDLKTLLLTIPSVLFARGATEADAEAVDDLGFIASLMPGDGGNVGTVNTQPIDDGRWEYGSILHWLPFDRRRPSANPWDDRAVYFGSGRDALLSLLHKGLSERGWKRLWVPTFFCQDVVQAFVDTGIEVRLYPYCAEDECPGFDKIDFRQGDVLLRMNFFGLHSSLQFDGVDRSVVEVIDDHTHDPWSDMAWHSDADWCMTSLRKVLPLPDGGVLWSPKGHDLPDEPEVTDERKFASLEKLGAMVLKAHYLTGHPFDRDIYRRLAASSEARLDEGEISGMPEWTRDLLGCFPVQEWRGRRHSNHKVLSDGLDGIPWLKVLQPDDERACPFAGILVFDSAGRRNYVQKEAAARRVFLSIMWPLDNPAVDDVPDEHKDFSRRILCAPCDVRYSPGELRKVARLIREIGDAYQP